MKSYIGTLYKLIHQHYKNNFNFLHLCNEFPNISVNQQIELFSQLLNIAVNSCKEVMNGSRNIIIKTHQKGKQIIIQEIFSAGNHENNEEIKSVLNEIIDNPNIRLTIKDISISEKSIIIYYNPNYQS